MQKRRSSLRGGQSLTVATHQCVSQSPLQYRVARRQVPLCVRESPVFHYIRTRHSCMLDKEIIMVEIRDLVWPSATQTP